MMGAAVAAPRFSEQALHQPLQAACGRLGVPATEARLVRAVANAVFHVPVADTILRIAGPASRLDRARKTVKVARWLAEIGFPAVRPRADVAQPLVAGDYVITFWDYRCERPGRAGIDEMAYLLRELHELRPPFVLPAWNPLADIAENLDDAQVLEPAVREVIDGCCAALEPGLEKLVFTLEPGLVHGDAWVGNLLRTGGTPLLLDFDQTCVGPREWDLVPTVVNSLRLGRPRADVGTLAEAYGFDVTGWDGFDVLRQVRELTVIAGVAPALASRPELAQEFHRRAAGLTSGSRGAWAPYT